MRASPQWWRSGSASDSRSEILTSSSETVGWLAKRVRRDVIVVSKRLLRTTRSSGRHHPRTPTMPKSYPGEVSSPARSHRPVQAAGRTLRLIPRRVSRHRRPRSCSATATTAGGNAGRGNSIRAGRNTRASMSPAAPVPAPAASLRAVLGRRPRVRVRPAAHRRLASSLARRRPLARASDEPPRRYAPDPCPHGRLPELLH